MVITDESIIVYGLLFLFIFTGVMLYIMAALVKEEKQLNFAFWVLIPHIMFVTLLPYNPIGGHFRAFIFGEEHRETLQIERSIELEENSTPPAQLLETD